MLKNLQDLSKLEKEFAGYVLWKDVDKDHYFLQCPLSEQIKFFILSDRQEVLKMVLKSLPRETPEFDNFSDEIEWQEKNRDTDSQLYNEGYDTCLSKIKQIINNLTNKIK